MLTFNVTEPLMRRPLNVGSGSTNFGIEFPSSSVWGVVTDACVVTPSDDCVAGIGADAAAGRERRDRPGGGQRSCPPSSMRRWIAAPDAGVLRAMGLLGSIAASSWDW